jgi:predicted butyrate kinase (DUF1464 family)
MPCGVSPGLFTKNLDVSGRIFEVERLFEKIISDLQYYHDDQLTFDELYETSLENPYFNFVFKLLSLYLLYKKEEKQIQNKDIFIESILKKLKTLSFVKVSEDYLLLACNFFINKLSNEKKEYWVNQFNVEGLGNF